MINPVTLQRWLYRLLFVAICGAVIFGRLLPVHFTHRQIPGPDLVLLFTFAWVLRRPDYVPFPVVALVLIATDILFSRAVGLGAGLGLVAVEFLRSRESLWRDLPVTAEFAMVALVLLMYTLGTAAIHGIFVVDQPPFGKRLLQLTITLISYPLVVALSRYGLGVSKTAPGEVDALGHRL